MGSNASIESTFDGCGAAQTDFANVPNDKVIQNGIDGVGGRGARDLIFGSWISASRDFPGTLLRQPAGLVGRDGSMQPKTDPMLPARGFFAIPIAVGNDAALEPARDKTSDLVVGHQVAGGQRIDHALGNSDPQSFPLVHTLCTHVGGNSRTKPATPGNERNDGNTCI